MDQTNQPISSVSSQVRATAFAVHIFTALGAGVALIAMLEAVREHWTNMFGWLGVALTGSDTSSNALFGSLQTITAGQLVDGGVLPLTHDQAKILLASANEKHPNGLANSSDQVGS